MKWKDLLAKKEAFQGKQWIWTGIGWGLFMYVIMQIVYPLWEGDFAWSRSHLIFFVMWIFGGLVWGWLVSLSVDKKSTDN